MEEVFHLFFWGRHTDSPSQKYLQILAFSAIRRLGLHPFCNVLSANPIYHSVSLLLLPVSYQSVRCSRLQLKIFIKEVEGMSSCDSLKSDKVVNIKALKIFLTFSKYCLRSDSVKIRDKEKATQSKLILITCNLGARRSSKKEMQIISLSLTLVFFKLTWSPSTFQDFLLLFPLSFFNKKFEENGRI